MTIYVNNYFLMVETKLRSFRIRLNYILLQQMYNLLDFVLVVFVEYLETFNDLFLDCKIEEKNLVKYRRLDISKITR